jgi:hypothetical protein
MEPPTLLCIFPDLGFRGRAGVVRLDLARSVWQFIQTQGLQLVPVGWSYWSDIQPLWTSASPCQTGIVTGDPVSGSVFTQPQAVKPGPICFLLFFLQVFAAGSRDQSLRTVFVYPGHHHSER